MATDGDERRQPAEDEMLPDERAAIAERVDSLDDEESGLTVEEVAADLGIELE